MSSSAATGTVSSGDGVVGCGNGIVGDVGGDDVVASGHAAAVDCLARTRSAFTIGVDARPAAATDRPWARLGGGPGRGGGYARFDIGTY